MLLKNGIALILSPSRIERVDLRVLDGSIVAKANILRPLKGEEIVDLSGKFIMPGMVNAHTHLYSALARGMSAPRQSPKNFLDILRKIWWKLDESLDEESIYYSALVGSIEAIKHGTTTLIDHHASPNEIVGSLDVIKKAMSETGLRGVLCYETTDRGGRRRRDAGLDENERFASENLHNPMVRGTIGAHASFTLNDDTMQALGHLSRMYECGVHIHVAEDKADVRDSVKQRGANLVRRLEKSGILSHKSILAHGVHLAKSELGRVEASGAWLVHNPRSNMNNAVGHAPLQWFSASSALGTDGFPADMFEECKLGFFRNQESDHRVAFARLPDMLQAGQRLAGSFFQQEFGTLAVGSAADLIVLDYSPPTPLTKTNLIGHFLFGMNSGMVAHTMVHGKWRMFNRQSVGTNEAAITGEAAKVAARLWKRVMKR
ncbi:MAG: putative aminohydrolase SsnA [Bacteroidetes bacterium]|nr:putative aminohydrolase SsnA [Bacteroidota bacterium]MCW5895323.1 putative aminohydrolase SsnA [Bacteroidota bacterium]